MFVDEACRFIDEPIAMDREWLLLGSGHTETKMLETGQSGRRTVPPATSSPPRSPSGAAAAGTDAAPVSPGAPPAPELAGGVAPARGAGGAPTAAYRATASDRLIFARIRW